MNDGNVVHRERAGMEFDPAHDLDDLHSEVEKHNGLGYAVEGNVIGDSSSSGTNNN